MYARRTRSFYAQQQQFVYECVSSMAHKHTYLKQALHTI